MQNSAAYNENLQVYRILIANPIDSRLAECYNLRKSSQQSVAEAKYPGVGPTLAKSPWRHPRERAMVEIPREPPGEEPFQVQAESAVFHTGSLGE